MATFTVTSRTVGKVLVYSGWTAGAVAFWSWILLWPRHYCTASDYFDGCKTYADGFQPWAVFSFFIVLAVYLIFLGLSLYLEDYK